MTMCVLLEKLLILECLKRMYVIMAIYILMKRSLSLSPLHSASASLIASHDVCSRIYNEREHLVSLPLTLPCAFIMSSILVRSLVNNREALGESCGLTNSSN
jgi:hypothetical protein